MTAESGSSTTPGRRRSVLSRRAHPNPGVRVLQWIHPRAGRRPCRTLRRAAPDCGDARPEIVYVCGPPALVDAVRSVVGAHADATVMSKALYRNHSWCRIARPARESDSAKATSPSTTTAGRFSIRPRRRVETPKRMPNGNLHTCTRHSWEARCATSPLDPSRLPMKKTSRSVSGAGRRRRDQPLKSREPT